MKTIIAVLGFALLVMPVQAVATCAPRLAGFTFSLTSTREPSRLMIDINLSSVKRPRSAFRIREKSAAAIPVRTCA